LSTSRAARPWSISAPTFTVAAVMVRALSEATKAATLAAELARVLSPHRLHRVQRHLEAAAPTISAASASAVAPVRSTTNTRAPSAPNARAIAPPIAPAP